MLAILRCCLVNKKPAPTGLCPVRSKAYHMAESGADQRASPSVVGFQVQPRVFIFGETGREWCCNVGVGLS